MQFVIDVLAGIGAYTVIAGAVRLTYRLRTRRRDMGKRTPSGGAS